jgi:hypothetical protein
MSDELESVREVVKRREGLNDPQFDELLKGWFEELEIVREEGGDLEDALADWFGLEPDYLFDKELGVLG